MYLTPGKSELVDADTLRLRIAGLLPPGARYGRVAHLDQVYESLPRDPKVRLEVSTVEIAPGCFNDFHYHAGSAIYILLQGKIEIHFPDEIKKYSAGDAYVEPIGVVHRAFNPHPDIPLTAVGVSLTANDREAIVNLTEALDGIGETYRFTPGSPGPEAGLG